MHMKISFMPSSPFVGFWKNTALLPWLDVQQRRDKSGKFLKVGRTLLNKFTKEHKSHLLGKLSQLILGLAPQISILTWLALGEDHAARSRRVEQLIAL